MFTPAKIGKIQQAQQAFETSGKEFEVLRVQVASGPRQLDAATHGADFYQEEPAEPEGRD